MKLYLSFSVMELEKNKKYPTLSLFSFCTLCPSFLYFYPSLLSYHSIIFYDLDYFSFNL